MNPDPQRAATLDRMTGLDLIAISEVADGPRVEGAFAAPFWLDTLADLVNRSIFDPDLRAHWPKIEQNWILYGDSTNWNVIWPVWKMQERTEAMKKPRLGFELLKGANHFVSAGVSPFLGIGRSNTSICILQAMWDQPKLLMQRVAKIQGAR